MRGSLIPGKSAMALLFAALAGSAAPTLAADWRLEPSVKVAATYSDNISLVSDAQEATDEYVTQISPSLSITGSGNRVRLNSSYTLQNLFYAEHSENNRSRNQLHLTADAELLEDFLYLSAYGQVSQQLLTPDNGAVADNLNIGSGREDVVTSRIQPSIRRHLGRFAELDLSYAEGRVNYDGDTVPDGRTETTDFSLKQGPAAGKLDWLMSYNQSRQWSGAELTSDTERSAAVLAYPLFNRLSLTVNGGREEGWIKSAQKFRSGSYWSAGLRWRPTPRLMLAAAQGDRDRQASVNWSPSPRTLLNVSYLDREVGVRARNALSGSFSHSTRRVRWGLTYVEEITTDQVQAITGLSEPMLIRYPNGVLVTDPATGKVVLGRLPLYGVVDEHYRRERGGATVLLNGRRNSLNFGIYKELRHYQLSGREARVRGGSAGWQFRVSPRAKADLTYTQERGNGSAGTGFGSNANIVAGEIERRSLSWDFERNLGKRTSAGLELRTTEVDGETAAQSRSENRITANAKMVF